jgi:hypothetical protein
VNFEIDLTMNTLSLLPRQAKRIAFGCFVWALLLTSWRPVAAQEAVKPLVTDSRPKNGMLLVVGYEMDKARADAILQKQDMTQDVKTVVGKLESLTKAKGAVHSSCAAQVIRSGMGSSLDMGAARLEMEPIIGASGEFVSLTMQRTDKASGTGSTVIATLEARGGYAFIGTVPDVKPGKDLLLFVRCVMHYLE